MQNNIFKILIVPEITLTILSIVCLLYGLFLNKNSFRKTSNFAIFVLLLTSVLVYFDYKTEFADYNQFFASSIFINYFKILVLIGSALSIIISKNYLSRPWAFRFMFLVIKPKRIDARYNVIDIENPPIYPENCNHLEPFG